jgi:hypothetical protein
LRRFVQISRVAVLLLIFAAGTVTSLWAHAILMQSKPAGNAAVKGPDVPIWLRFNVRVDGKRSRLTMVATDGSTVPMPPAKQTAPDVLEVQVTGLRPGTYKLQWQVLASDGHMSHGEVDFTVN